MAPLKFDHLKFTHKSKKSWTCRQPAVQKSHQLFHPSALDLGFLLRSQQPADSILTDFPADATDIVRGEIFVIWRNFGCGDILDVEIFCMWRNFRYGELLDMEKC